MPVLSRATSTSSPLTFTSGVSNAFTTGGGALAAGSTRRNSGGAGRLMSSGLLAGSVESALLHVLNVVTEDAVVTNAKAPLEENATALAGALNGMVCMDCSVEETKIVFPVVLLQFGPPETQARI